MPKFCTAQKLGPRGDLTTYPEKYSMWLNNYHFILRSQNLTIALAVWLLQRSTTKQWWISFQITSLRHLTWMQHDWARSTYVVMLTLDDGMTNTRLGAISTDVSHVTTRSPSKNFPGVAPPAPQIQIICKRKVISVPHTTVLLTGLTNLVILRTMWML